VFFNRGDDEMANAGPERKADMAGALNSNPGGGGSLGKAVGHLKAEHPQKYDDLGPHHHTMDHDRHMPLGGMKPGKGEC
jgi:hypothetical protein